MSVDRVPHYLELGDGKRSDLAQVILKATDLCFEVLKGDGDAFALAGNGHEPVLGHLSWKKGKKVCMCEGVNVGAKKRGTR